MLFLHRFLALVKQCYRKCSAYDLLSLSTIKRFAAEALLAAENQQPLSSSSSKSLQEDAAILRRIWRLSASKESHDHAEGEAGPNGKFLLMSGECWCCAAQSTIATTILSMSHELYR